MTAEQQDLRIKDLLDQGKQAFASKDYEASIEKVGEACQLLDSVHGELALESGDAYFLYGRALLECAIYQNTVLDETEQAPSAEAVKNTINARLQTEDKPELVPNGQEADAKEPSKDESAGDMDGEHEEEEGEEAKVEDDFETAWDVLDVARVIFEKCDETESQLKLADVLMCLGDVSLETEKFNEALPDYKRAVEIKLRLLKPDNRQLAEAHYKYALALELSSENSSMAMDELKKAVDVLMLRIKTLESQDEGKGKTSSEPSLDDKSANEIAEIKELIIDIKEKIEELENMAKTESEAGEILKTFLGAQDQEIKTLSSATVNDLTSMIKRKAPPATDVESKQKNPKLEKEKDDSQ